MESGSGATICADALYWANDEENAVEVAEKTRSDEYEQGGERSGLGHLEI